MINNELLDYVRSQKVQNIPSAVIRTNLHMMGKWTDDEITKALINPEIQKETSPQVTQTPIMASMPQTDTPDVLSAQNTPSGVDLTSENPASPIVQTSNHKNLKTAIIVLAAFVVIGGVYVAYGKLGPSSSGYYSEDDFLSGLMTKYANIKSATYTSAVDITTSEKDSNTKPFPILDEKDQDSYYGYSYFPAIGSIHASFSAGANWEDEDSDVKFNLNATGDMGDLTYKADIDGIKKDKVLYIKINNFPNFFFFDLSNIKNQWIRLTTDDAGFLSENIAQLADEADQEDSKKEAKALLAEFTSLLEKNSLISFSKDPKEEKIGDDRLIKYSLKLNEEALATSYLTMYEKYKDSESIIASEIFGNESRAATMGGNDFRKLFDYYLSSNGALVLWTDTKGNPVAIDYVASFLTSNDSERQINVSFRFEVADVNKNITVEAPEETQTLEEVMEAMWSSGPLGEAREKGNDAKTKANLSGLRTAAEIFYDNNNGYGVTTNSCSTGMFADKTSGMDLYVNVENYPSGTTLSCNAKSTAYAVSAKLSTGEYFCVDSVGSSKEIDSALKNGVYSCR